MHRVKAELLAVVPDPFFHIRSQPLDGVAHGVQLLL